MRERILNDLKNAMKNQDKELLNVIRMVKGAIQMEELNLKRDLNDDEVISIVTKQIKTRKESIAEFIKGNREELIEKTQGEIDILNKYLPEQLSEEEVEKIIDDAFSKINPTSPSDMGKIMGLVTPLVKGKTDMGSVSLKIKDRLNNNK